MAKTTMETNKNALSKRLRASDSYIMILEKDGIVKLHTNVFDAQLLADTLVTFANEVIGTYAEYQKNMIEAQKAALEKAKEESND